MTEKNTSKGFESPIGYRESLLIAGLILIGWGLWWIFPPAALIVPGLILAGVAIFGVKA